MAIPAAAGGKVIPTANNTLPTLSGRKSPSSSTGRAAQA
jgi:hypothetical protein